MARSAAAAGQFLNGGGERPKTAVLLISVFAKIMKLYMIYMEFYVIMVLKILGIIIRQLKLRD